MTTNVTLVLSFSGDRSDFPKETQEQILEAVRTITGNSAISIVGTEVGSFHLFIEATRDDLVLLRSSGLQDQLSTRLGVELIDIETRADFENSRLAARQLLNASEAVLNWPRTLPDGTAIERPELIRLLEVEDDADGHTKAVIGDPGSGKTALLGALAHNLQLASIPFLAIKADFLSEDISTEQDLRDSLRLPDLPTHMLERLATRGPVFLIIDQLNALAGYIDLRTGRLSVLLNMVRELGNKRNLHVIVSARRFEYEHDTV